MMKEKKLKPQIIPTSEEFFTVDFGDVTKYLSKVKGAETLKIVFFGTPDFVLPILEVIDKSFNLVAVVSNPDQILGRKKILTPTPVSLWVQENAKQALVFTPEKLSSHELIKQLVLLEADLFVVAAFGKIIPQSLLDIPKFGALNVHPSLLPKYRGASPIQSIILNGDTKTGLTIIKMDPKMDHGPIVYQKAFELSDKDNFETLHKKLFHHGADVLEGVIKDFVEGKIKLKAQDEKEATFCKILKKEDGYFDINNPPSLEQLNRMIRAFYPWPTAWTLWKGKVVKFFPEKKVQLEGGKKVNLKDFLNGHPDFPIKPLI